MKSYINDMIVADPNGEKSILYPTTKQEAVEGLQDRLTNIEIPDITTTDQTTLENSNAGRVKINKIKGNMEQKSTEGNQLFDASQLVTRTQNNITVTNNGDGSFTISGSENNNFVLNYEIEHKDFVKLFKVGKLYAKAETNTFPYFYINIVIDGVNNPFLDLRQSNFAEAEITQEQLDNETSRLVIGFYGYSSGTIKGGTIKPIVYQDGDGTWEKFTGGKPSPSPSYPQEIKGVKGKNLLDCRGLTERTVNGITYTPKYSSTDEDVKSGYPLGSLMYIEANNTATADADYVCGSFTLLPKEEYIFSGCPNGGSTTTYRMGFTNVGNEYGSGIKYSSENGLVTNPFIRIQAGYTANNLRFYPMIRSASVLDDTYVPYGLIRIKTYKAKGLVNPKTCVNGILNTSGVMTTVTTWTTSDYMEVTRGAKISVSSNMKVVRFAEYDANKNFIKNTSNIIGVNDETYEPWTTTLESNTKYVRASFGLETSITPQELFKNYWIQIEEGEPTKFELYEENSIILSQPMELYGNEIARDLLTPREIERKYVKETVNSVYGMDSSGLLARLNINFEPVDIVSPTNIPNILCDVALAMGLYDARNAEYAIASNSNRLFIRNADIEQTVEAYNALIAENPITVVYELAEPTTEALPIADQIALNSLQSFDGITYIEFDCEIQPTWEVKYGTSEVGGYTLESLLTARNNELKQELALERITALEATLVNNI